MYPINTVLCPIRINSNTIELIVHTSVIAFQTYSVLLCFRPEYHNCALANPPINCRAQSKFNLRMQGRSFPWQSPVKGGGVEAKSERGKVCVNQCANLSCSFFVRKLFSLGLSSPHGWARAPNLVSRIVETKVPNLNDLILPVKLDYQ